MIDREARLATARADAAAANEDAPVVQVVKLVITQALRDRAMDSALHDVKTAKPNSVMKGSRTTIMFSISQQRVRCARKHLTRSHQPPSPEHDGQSEFDAEIHPTAGESRPKATSFSQFSSRHR